MSGAVQIPFPPSRKFQRSNDADYLYYGIIRHLLLKRPRVAVLRTRLSPRKSPFQRAKALGNPHNSTLVRSVASQRPHQMCDRPTSTCKKSSGNQQQTCYTHVKSVAGKQYWIQAFFFFFYQISTTATHANTAQIILLSISHLFLQNVTNTGVTVTDVCRRQKPDKWRHCQQAGRTICQISISAGLEYSNSKQLV